MIEIILINHKARIGTLTEAAGLEKTAENIKIFLVMVGTQSYFCRRAFQQPVHPFQYGCFGTLYINFIKNGFPGYLQEKIVETDMLIVVFV